MTILADSCCDLSPELLKKTQAKIAPLTITIDDTHYVARSIFRRIWPP